MPTRLAWCYGDPGASRWSSWLAGRAFGREDWEREALAVARRAGEARGRTDVFPLVDAGLCHGTVGTRAHLPSTFPGDRRRGAPGSGALLDSAHPRSTAAGPRRGRVPQTLARGGASRPGPRWSEETGFLTGAAGIALALLAAC